MVGLPSQKSSARATLVLAIFGVLSALLLFEFMYPYVVDKVAVRSANKLQPIKRHARLREHPPLMNILVTPSEEYLKETDSLEKNRINCQSIAMGSSNPHQYTLRRK